MVDCGCKKIQVKGEKRGNRRRSDKDQTKDRRRAEGGEINKAALSAALFIGYLN